jgi:hypothetical protein
MNFQDIPARILSIRVKPTTKIPALARAARILGGSQVNPYG